MPSLVIAPHPEGCTGPSTMPAPGVTSASGAMPTDVTFRRLEIGVQAIQLSPYHAGPAHASVPAPGPDRRFSGMRLSRSPFGSGLAIGPRNLPSSSSRLRRGYDKAPRGAMEGVVIHERRLLAQQWAARARTSDVPHRCNRPSHKNKEESSLDNVRGQVLLTDLVLVLSPAAVYDWDLVSFGKTAYTATKATGHAHQMGVVQLVVRPHQPTPPVPKTASRVAQRVVSVQDDPIDTVITPL